MTNTKDCLSPQAKQAQLAPELTERIQELRREVWRAQDPVYTAHEMNFRIYPLCFEVSSISAEAEPKPATNILSARKVEYSTRRI